MILYVKNMLSERCKIFVEEQLREVGLSFRFVEIGVVDISSGWTQEQREELESRLIAGGLEIKINRKVSIVERVETVVKEMIDDMNETRKGNYSDYLSEKLNMDYALISKVFSETKGITIQQHIILTKIEKIIELLGDDSMSLTDISFKLQYSSVAHLSNQFKKITGYSPSDFKKLGKTSLNEALTIPLEPAIGLQRA
jgi:AraC-like DNA-binding protein